MPALKDMFRTYLRQIKENGLYGTVPIAIYSGSNALTQLATSALEGDGTVLQGAGFVS